MIDNLEQVDEMMHYCKLMKSLGRDITSSRDYNDICREWIIKYAAKWRELKDDGLDPAEYIRHDYAMSEDWLRQPTGNLRRQQSVFPQSYRPSASYGGVASYNKSKPKAKRKRKTLSEKLDRILEELIRKGTNE